MIGEMDSSQKMELPAFFTNEGAELGTEWDELEPDGDSLEDDRSNLWNPNPVCLSDDFLAPGCDLDQLDHQRSQPT